MNKLYGLLLLICAGGAMFLTILFFAQPAPIEVKMVRLDEEMVKENEAKMKEEEKRQQAAHAAQARADLEKRLYRCKSNEECIIVDKDPCGCARGPQGVTAINSDLSLEYSKLMEKKFAKIEVCPDVASKEKECSPKARPVCEANRCKIAY
ncbi:MAG: hypothetical protein J6U96_02565 [Elusimicrobiaceae bacterium]|nr:hypothetical protein [Elusimicrobiaceae bacterium]